MKLRLYRQLFLHFFVSFSRVYGQNFLVEDKHRTITVVQDSTVEQTEISTTDAFGTTTSELISTFTTHSTRESKLITFSDSGRVRLPLNRYRRGLETCPQAKTFKSEGSATTLFSSLFFPTCPTQLYDSSPSGKYSRPLLIVFACIG